jgi:recombination protein RecA
LWPEMTNVYIAIEPFDQTWAKKLGVDTDKLIVMYPAFAEEVVDMAADFIASEDTGIVAIDSLAAMITTAEAEKSAEKNSPGVQGLVTGKLVRKTLHAMAAAQKQDRMPTLLYINQIRHKIGVMFGDPETLPGGNAPLFQAQLRLRVWSKAIKDPKISEVYPVRREVHFIMKKAKVGLLADNGKFEMVTHPHGGLNIGEVADFATIIEHLKHIGSFTKATKGTGYEIIGEHYPTIQAFKEYWYTNRKWALNIRQAIISNALEEKEKLIQPKAGGVVESDDVDEGEEEQAA